MPKAPPTFKLGVKTKRVSVSSQQDFGFMYNYQWQKARKIFLQHHPLCIMCTNEGRVTPATVVDHIINHKGNEKLFWDIGNWQPLCKKHHDSDKQRVDRARAKQA